MKEQYTEIEQKMKKSINVLHDELATVRAGRANPAVLDKVMVDYYGVATPVPQVGTISVPEARTLIVQPWDASMLKEIEKAILASDIGINPNNDGKVIRLNFPQLNEERRKELVKQVERAVRSLSALSGAMQLKGLRLRKRNRKSLRTI